MPPSDSATVEGRKFMKVMPVDRFRWARSDQKPVIVCWNDSTTLSPSVNATFNDSDECSFGHEEKNLKNRAEGAVF